MVHKIEAIFAVDQNYGLGNVEYVDDKMEIIKLTVNGS